MYNMTIFIKDNKIVELPISFKVKRPISKTITFEEAIVNVDEIENDPAVEPVIIPAQEITMEEFVEFDLSYEELAEEEFKGLGYSIAPDQPEYDPVWHKCVWIDNQWQLLPSKKAIHREVKWVRIRNRRNHLLNTTDEIIRQHIEDNQQIPSEWVEYRNALRNIPNVYETGEIDDVDLVAFPEMPHQFEQPLYKELYDKLNDENVIEALRINRNTLYQNLLDVKWKQLRNIENEISDSELDAQVQYLEDLIDEHMKDEMTPDPH